MSAADTAEQTFSQAEIDRATRRLISLARLGASTDENGETTPEAQRAQEQLAELTAKYRISEATLAAKRIEDGTYTVDHTEVNLSDGYPDFQTMLFSSVADAYGLEVITSTFKQGRGRRPKVVLHIYGSENAASLVIQLYSEILAEVFDGMFKYLDWRKSMATHYGLTRSQIKNIQTGYAAGYGTTYGARVRSLTEEHSSALVLVKDAIDKEVAIQHPNLKISRVRLDGHAHEKGQETATNAPVGGNYLRAGS